MSTSEQLAELRRTWAPPAGLAGSGPRPVRLAAGGIFLAVMAAVFFVAAVAAGVGLGAMATRQATESALLRAQGTETEARIMRLWRTTEEEHAPMVTYEFAWQGHRYRKQVRVPYHTWRTMTTGAALAVRFLAANPRVSHPRDWDSRPLPHWVAFLVAAILAAIGGLCTWMLRNQVRLLREGRAAPGVVTGYSRTQNGKVVHYEFALLSGATAKGRRGPLRINPPIGTPLCVVYDTDNPRRSAPYPMDMVKLADAGRRPGW